MRAGIQMINGVEMPEISYESLEFGSHDPFDDFSPWIGQELDVGSDEVSPTLSNYSSCEESEFERYCSANSVVGSSSFCSSVGNHKDFSGYDSFSPNFGGDREDRRFDFHGFRKSARSAGNKNYANTGCCDNSSNELESPAESSDDEAMVGAILKGGNSPSGNSLLCEDVGKHCQEEKFIKSNVQIGSSSLETNTENTLLNITHFAENDSKGPADGTASQFSVAANETNSCEVQFRSVSDRDDDNISLCLQGVTDEHVQLQSEEAKTVPEKARETPLRHEYSDDELMLDSGTDEDGRSHEYERRNLQYLKENKVRNENPLLITSAVAFGSSDWDEFEHNIRENGVLDGSSHKQREILEPKGDSSENSTGFKELGQLENRQDIVVTILSVQSVGISLEAPNSSPVENFHSEEEGQLMLNPQALCSMDDTVEHEPHYIHCKEMSTSVENLLSCPLSDSRSDLIPSITTEPFKIKETGLEDHNSNEPLKPETGHAITPKQSVLDCTAPNDRHDEVHKLDMDELYEEMVHDMEKVLLDSTESHVRRFSQSEKEYFSPRSQPLRDGSSTASTSGTDDPYPSMRYSPKIEWVEVIGAKQRKGDVSFGERLVGVKEYTVYRIRVWSGKDQWEIERRYRDFFTLYQQLKSLFKEHGLSLPCPWSGVEMESRKIFGNISPNVVTERSALIQDCLRSILLPESPLGIPRCLVWFLSSSPVLPKPSIPSTSGPQYSQKYFHYENAETCTEGVSTLGKTISLLVDLHPHKSMKQMLEAQNYMCAGCHKHLEDANSLMKEFVKALVWGKPRLCEYTGQLYCASCHTNDTAVLPARVLHHWDFTLYPVSQLAKAYLESIYDQPMLCVSAVNPFLFSKVPALRHVMGIRKKLGSMVSYIRCPFRRSIQKGLGSRRYLLESNEFFALRDLVDLSKGAFSGLPILVENVSRKILEHITQQCLVCCDVGIACGARQACEDPSSFIFPFQEDEIKRCSSCNTVFHKPCYEKLAGCPCAKPAGSDLQASLQEKMPQGMKNMPNGSLDMTVENPDSNTNTGFFSNLLSMAKREMSWRNRNSTPVILMGSLPSNSL
ncbi:hypothetical protein H6P81_009829 [Aristolochia fimbriata]|uniref:PX domain-containing protein n=1 Tax=Aristolochia fimbriata TaxID=158543 RepID=A0AAV7EMW5_ARIFI|nr:hypothetical protein H6P81_009829 [Aristolochia fimbriata]